MERLNDEQRQAVKNYNNAVMLAKTGRAARSVIGLFKSKMERSLGCRFVLGHYFIVVNKKISIRANELKDLQNTWESWKD